MTDLCAFVRRLAESVAAHDPAGLHAPLPVGDIMHRMMPYRACRGALGLETAEDYELLMMRLLGEEGGLARVWPPESAERCRVEVAAILPDLSLLQELQGVTVQIDLGVLSQVEAVPVTEPRNEVAEPEKAGDEGGPPPGEAASEVEIEDAEPSPEAEHHGDEGQEPGRVAESEPDPVPGADQPVDLEYDMAADGAEADPTDTAKAQADEPEPFEDTFDTEETLLPDGPGDLNAAAPEGLPSPVVRWEIPSTPAETSEPLECPHCSQTLPRGRTVRFCPSCGQDVRTRRCGACRAELQAEWRHCVMCGAPAGDSSRFA